MFTLLLVALSAALAQDPESVDWQKQQADKAEKPKSNLSIEIGGSYTSGNSVAITAYGLITAGHKWDSNQIGLEAKGAFGSNIPDANGDGKLDASERAAGLEANTQRVGGKLRYDRLLTDKDSLYVLAGGFHDPFSGFGYRLHEQIGYSRKLVDAKRTVGEGDAAKDFKTQLVAELGIDYAQEHYIPGVDPIFAQFIAGRAQIAFTHEFNENASISEQIEAYENFFTPDDLRLYNTIALSAKINATLSLKVSHDLSYYNRPPDPDLKKLDQTVLVTLVASLI